ncbi:alpha-1,2-fucosyltransferase [Flavobacterium urumqiense]|uniref:Glycosyl transferase family 11 n=1 Tax=Flavobacterium urumqiense TaxID=935224 RepID=A0A1H6AUC7_9FLAO|nr:alpha-1,2-fucosyltransferase [Flavobacterium urumqiense]SEG51647.1 Glycosyl transferase family 11 [Flavobacterium urumqiense]
MITFSKLEKKGHLGNQLFQIASTIGIAVENDHDFCFPKWSHNWFFKNELPVLLNQEFTAYKEEQFHYKSKKLDAENYDLEGWFQSEKYFDIELTKYYFEFKADFIQQLKNVYKEAFSKKTILLSIRRGDFVDHKDYFQLPINYYVLALLHNFPDWKERNLIVLSDDIDYCKFHFSFLDNAFFGDCLSGIEQLALGSLCDDFIISNSTFSWWCAWLGEKEHSTVVRPLHYFTAAKNKKDNDNDYFPDRWKIFNHLNLKIDLQNTVVALKSLNPITEEYLSHYFHFANENQMFYWSSFKESNTLKENSLLLINDCIIPPFCIYNAIQKEENSVGFLKGSYLNISKYLDYDLFKKQFDYGLFTKILNQKKGKHNPKELLFVFFPTKPTEKEISFLKNLHKSKVFEAPGYSLYFSFAGKIKGFFESKYYLAVKKRSLIVFIKTSVKNIIRPKKN